MAGLIGTGESYKGRALSGMVRQSALEEQIRQANKELETQRKIQKTQMAGSMTGLGAMAGSVAGPAIWGGMAGVGTGAGTGAMIGLPAGPFGMLLGAGLGFLFSQLF